jgi:hypothetical protein
MLWNEDKRESSCSKNGDDGQTANELSHVPLYAHLGIAIPDYQVAWQSAARSFDMKYQTKKGRCFAPFDDSSTCGPSGGHRSN